MEQQDLFDVTVIGEGQQAYTPLFIADLEK